MEILRRSSFSAVPWKNGGGTTHEVMREPAGADPYHWRLSIADVVVAGPFSSFAGYQRIMVLLAGNGVRLTFLDGAPRELVKVGELIEFDGANAPQCQLLAGPCTDLNLIVSNSIATPAVRVADSQAPQFYRCDVRQTMLMCAVRGSFLVAGAGPTVTMNPWDVAVLSPGDGISLTPTLADSLEVPLVFVASLDDNRSPVFR